MEYYESGSPFTCHNEPWSSFRPVVSCDGDFQVHARQQHASTKVIFLLLFCNCILLSSSMYAQSFYFHYWKLAKNLAPVPLTSLIWVISLIFFRFLFSLSWHSCKRWKKSLFQINMEWFPNLLSQASVEMSDWLNVGGKVAHSEGKSRWSALSDKVAGMAALWGWQDWGGGILFLLFPESRHTGCRWGTPLGWC